MYFVRIYQLVFITNANVIFNFYIVVDNGDNWSVGQRQLLCLGRVMLKQSRLLFMDEATASVDSQTDAVIQRIIREDFAARTIISIAHRIPTVMDCDRVLVVDAGIYGYDMKNLLQDSANISFSYKCLLRNSSHLVYIIYFSFNRARERI